MKSSEIGVWSAELDHSQPGPSESDHAETKQRCISKSSCKICSLLRHYTAQSGIPYCIQTVYQSQLKRSRYPKEGTEQDRS